MSNANSTRKPIRKREVKEGLNLIDFAESRGSPYTTPATG